MRRIDKFKYGKLLENRLRLKMKYESAYYMELFFLEICIENLIYNI